MPRLRAHIQAPERDARAAICLSGDDFLCDRRAEPNHAAPRHDDATIRPYATMRARDAMRDDAHHVG